MKRGLVILDPQEVPPGELAGRTTSMQSSMRQQGAKAAFIYGDVYHSGDITYLSNLCIYWNEGVLAVPADGSPALLSKLSSRVHPWMRSTSNLKDLRSGANLGDLARDFLKAESPGIVGLVEMDWWPAHVVDDMQAKLPGWEFRDLGAIVQLERRQPSASEQKLLRQSAEISGNAVAIALDRTLTNPERAGRAELSARMAGVEDVLVHCHPATEAADTVEVLAEYRGYWTLAARVLFKATPEWKATFLQAYAAAEQGLRAGVDVAQLRLAAAALLTGRSIPWRLDLIHHTDLETGGDYRLPGEESSVVKAGSVVGLRLEFAFADGSHAVAADTFEIGSAGASRLTQVLPQVFP